MLSEERKKNSLEETHLFGTFIKRIKTLQALEERLHYDQAKHNRVLLSAIESIIHFCSSHPNKGSREKRKKMKVSLNLRDLTATAM